MSVRSWLKAVLEVGLVGSGIAALRLARLPRHSLVLAYHNVVPDDCPLGTLHLARGTFAEQIEQLLRTCSIVPLEEIFTPRELAALQALRGTTVVSARHVAEWLRTNRIPEGSFLLLTFDDGYRGAVTVGVAELARRGVPATLFIAPGFVGNGPYWWDSVTTHDGRDVDGELRDHAIRELRGEDRRVRRWARDCGLDTRVVPDYALVASEEELRRAVRHPGITLASHTWSHRNLARLTGAELREELTRPLEWLRQRFTAVIPWLSYPYGVGVRATEVAAVAAGYRAAVSLGNPWRSPDPGRAYAIPRLNVPSGLSLNGFALRTSGLIGSAA